MINYLQNRLNGRSIDNLLFQDDITSIKRTNSQTTLNGSISMHITSDLHDIICNAQLTGQVEKLAAAGGGITSGRRLISSSSPIIIPTKPVCSNASSHSSSSYTSVGDQMSSISETSQSHHDVDNELCTSLTTLPPSNQQLQHSAARDRIAVKNKLRQPIKQKLGTVKETDDNQTDLFSSISFHDQTSSLPTIESKVQPQLIVDLADLDTARSRLRVHSADKNLSTNVLSIQRSTSCKRPQEIKLINRSIYQRTNYQDNGHDDDDDDDDNEQEETKQENYQNKSRSRSPPEEHIYDNLDLFKHSRVQLPKDLPFHDNQSSTNLFVQTREHSPLTKTRLRPVTVHIASNNENQTVNEFENVFNQLKKRSMMKKVPSTEEILPEPSSSEESVTVNISSITIKEETIIPVLNENESTVPHVISTNKTIETSSSSSCSSSVIQQPNRRKTVGGVYLSTNNKVATTDAKPAQSWIDIAKEKQSKFQTISNENSLHDEADQQPPSTIEPVLVSRKEVTLTSNLTMIKDNTSQDLRTNRKSMIESTTTRQSSPSTPMSTAIERDSIRALKTDRPNRINNLIQFFDK
ncbi:hypothetical protein I4U23_019420 [Adineta vaga]|nr:hypothetical protein I4U23_019420 [Adineta vaga]